MNCEYSFSIFQVYPEGKFVVDIDKTLILLMLHRTAEWLQEMTDTPCIKHCPARSELTFIHKIVLQLGEI